MTTWTDQNTTETNWNTEQIGVRVISEINNSYLYNQPTLNYLGYYLVSETQYSQAPSIETAWAES